MIRFKRRLSWSLLFVCLLSTFIMTVSAAKLTCSWLPSTVTVGSEKTSTAGEGGWTVNSDNSISGTAKGGWLFVNYTGQFTLTFTFSEAGTFSFNWVLTNANGGKLAVPNQTATSNTNGSYTTSVAAGSTVKVVITSKDGGGPTTATLRNVTFVPLKTINVTFNPVEGLSYEVGGKTVNSANGAQTVSVADTETSITVVPTYSETGVKIREWRKTDDAPYSYNETVLNKPADDIELTPVIAGADVATYQIKGTTKNYYDLNLAIDAAGTKGTIVVTGDGTVPDGNYAIPEGVMLLIPFNLENTSYTTAPGTEESYSAPTAYRTLTMESGANIVVEDGGAISVSGKHSSKMNSYNGQPFGPQGFIVMNEGSNITVEAGGVLYAWGYVVGEKRATKNEIPKGGTVTIESGGTVYECFQVTDYRGGTATSGMTSESSSQDNVDTYHVFPMSQYYVQNVQVPMTLMAGAIENGYFSVAVSAVGNKSAPVPFIGNEGMFRISNGYIVKDYDETSDRLIIDIYGDMEMAPMFISIAAGFLGMTVDIDSNDYVLPLTNNLTATLHSGHTLDITQDLAILPGAELNIEEGATVNIGTASAKKSVYVYDTDEWGGYCSEYNVKFRGLSYAYDRFETRTENDLVDAVILVDGTVNAANGYAYTTTGGANIYSTGTGKILDVVPGTSTLYQATQSNTTISYVEIPITSAKLKNGNGTYVTTDSDALTYTYTGNGKNGRWVHNGVAEWHYDEVTTDANGTEVTVSYVKPYATLNNAATAYDEKGYIQMVASTSEPGGTTNKTVYLDLNGNNVTFTSAASFGALHGFDSATNALGATGSSYGKIVGTVNGTVAPVHTPNSGANAHKTYVAVKDDEGLHFHRVRLGIDHYSFYSYNGQGALTFAAAYLGDSEALGALVDLGMSVNGTEKWYDGDEATSVQIVDGTVGQYTTTENTKINGYTLTGTLTGDMTLTDSFVVHAMLKANGIGAKEAGLASTATLPQTDHFVDGITFQAAKALAEGKNNG